MMATDEHLASAGIDEGDEAADRGYRSLSAGAVSGLGLGLASVVAFLHPALCVVPVVAAVMSVVALRRIAAATPPPAGRVAAALGLALALLLGSGAMTRFVVRTERLERESRAVADRWFEHLANGQPHHAHQWTVVPKKRLSLVGNLWKSYRQSPDLQEALRFYVRENEVRTMLALGTTAQVRHYESISLGSNPTSDGVQHYYAVTYQDGDRRRSFFVGMKVFRVTDPAAGVTGWMINDIRLGVKPPSWPDSVPASPVPTRPAQR